MYVGRYPKQIQPK